MSVGIAILYAIVLVLASMSLIVLADITKGKRHQFKTDFHYVLIRNVLAAVAVVGYTLAFGISFIV